MELRTTQRGIKVPNLGILPTAVGVYRLWSPNAPGSYIGSTCDLHRRSHQYWLCFVSKPKADGSIVGMNRHLQNFVTQSGGPENMIFEVLEHLPQDTRNFAPELLAAEAKWTLHFRDHGGVLQDTIGMTWTEERKQRMRRENSVARNTPEWYRKQLAMHQKAVERYTALLADPSSKPGLQRSPMWKQVRNASTKPPGALCDEQVREIRRRRSQGEGPSALGAVFGLTHAAISYICSGRSYSRVS